MVGWMILVGLMMALMDLMRSKIMGLMTSTMTAATMGLMMAARI